MRLCASHPTGRLRRLRLLKKDPENWTGVGYTMMYLVATAVRYAGPGADRDKIRRELAALKNVPTVLGNGKYSYDANRDAVYGATLITVQDGKFALAPK